MSNRINEIEKECPLVADELDKLINSIASYRNIINIYDLDLKIVDEIKSLRNKLDGDLRKFL